MREEKKYLTLNNLLILLNFVVVLTLISLIFVTVNKYAYIINNESFQIHYFSRTIRDFMPFGDVPLFVALSATAIGSMICAVSDNVVARYIGLAISTTIMLFTAISLFGCIEYAEATSQLIIENEPLTEAYNYHISGWSVYVISSSFLIVVDNLFFAIYKTMKK